MRAQLFTSLVGVTFIWPLACNAKLIAPDFFTVGSDTIELGEHYQPSTEFFKAKRWNVRGPIHVEEHGLIESDFLMNSSTSRKAERKYWRLYAEDFGRDHPDPETPDTFSANVDSEAWTWIHSSDDGWGLNQDLQSEIIPREPMLGLPEPESLLLISIGILGIIGLRRRNAKKMTSQSS